MCQAEEHSSALLPDRQLSAVIAQVRTSHRRRAWCIICIGSKDCVRWRVICIQYWEQSIDLDKLTAYLWLLWCQNPVSRFKQHKLYGTVPAAKDHHHYVFSEVY